MVVVIIQSIRMHTPSPQASNIPLPSPSKEHLDYKHLQAGHRDHQSTLDEAEVEHPGLCTPHSAEVPVLACAEVLLLADEGRDLAGEF